MRRGARWPLLLALVAAVLVGTLAAVSSIVLRLERARFVAEAESARQDSIRLALWRIESLLAPVLALEARRPAGDYDAFAAEPVAYNRLLQKIRPGEILVPSPLLGWRSELFPLHFQFDAAGMSSPQAPQGNALEVACELYVPSELVGENRAALEALQGRLDLGSLAERVRAGEARLDRLLAEGLGEPPPVPLPQDQAWSSPAAQVARTEGEYSQRNVQIAPNFRNDANQLGEVWVDPAREEARAEVGPLIPLFTGARTEDPGDLLLVRRAMIAGAERFQGLLCDWPRLCTLLESRVEDLLPGARLVPLVAYVAAAADGAAAEEVDVADRDGLRLASLPVALAPPPASMLAMPRLTAERLVLGGLWAAMLGGLLFAAVALRTTTVYGEKKSRFAAAVTHELRTPLTTFQLYTEMLADGMVPDGARRQELLDTLRRESLRLSDLVESVLAYSRIEGGRQRTRPQVVDAAPLLERVLVAVARRAEAAGLELRPDFDLARGARVLVDEDGLLLVLGNLVDNAGKYAADGADKSLRLTARSTARGVEIDVRDHGPGIPRSEHDAVFEAFERGSSHRDDPRPGLGLGLSLARALSREMGGELAIVPHDGEGAWFRVTLRGA